MNCQQMLKDLSENGLTQAKISSETGVSQGYISELLNGLRGSRVGFEVAQRIKTLWDQKREQELDQPCETKKSKQQENR